MQACDRQTDGRNSHSEIALVMQQYHQHAWDTDYLAPGGKYSEVRPHLKICSNVGLIC